MCRPKRYATASDFNPAQTIFKANAGILGAPATMATPIFLDANMNVTNDGVTAYYVEINATANAEPFFPLTPAVMAASAQAID